MLLFKLLKKKYEFYNTSSRVSESISIFNLRETSMFKDLQYVKQCKVHLLLKLR